MYGQVLGATTTGTGAATIAVLPATGGLRTVLLVFGITAITLGIVTLSVASVAVLRERTAKKHI